MDVFHINTNYMVRPLHQLMIEKLNFYSSNSVFAPMYIGRKTLINPNDNVFVSECFKKWDRLLFDYKQKKIINAITQKFKIEDFDIIHAYTLFTDGNAAMNLSKKYNVPYVVAIRNTDLYTFFKYMPFLRNRGIKIMANASRIFYLSPAYERDLLEKYVPKNMRNVLTSKTEYIPNGIDDFWLRNKFYDRILNNNCIKLLYVGEINKNKNIGLILEAMSILEDHNYSVSLSIVGKIKNYHLYKELTKRKSVKYLGQMEKEKLIEVYRNNDIFVMPSHHETFGLVYAEAMTQGMPVIYTKGQGFDGQFEEGIVGYHVCDNNKIDLSVKIERIYKDYARISNNCLCKVDKFNWELICKKYYDVYKDVLNEQ